MKHIYYSSWRDVLQTTVGMILLAVYSYVRYGFTSAFCFGLIAFICLEIYLIWRRYNIHVEIRDNEWLINAGQRMFVPDTLNIQEIRYIARAPRWIFKTGQSVMIIFVKGKGGDLKQTNFQEWNYDAMTLRAILLRLMSLNPNIDIDHQYGELINDPEDKADIKNIPAERSMEDIERYVQSKYVDSC